MPSIRPDLSLLHRPGYWLAWSAAATYNTLRDITSWPLGSLLVFNGAHFALWALLGTLALPFIRRWPLTRQPTTWLAHLLFGSALTLVDVIGGHWLTYRLLGSELALVEIVQIAIATCFHLGLLTYAMLVAVVLGLQAQQLARQRAIRAGELEAALAQAQLRALRSQLQPHFLFNSLHSISALMHEDTERAERMLADLGELLRSSLREADATVVPLARELALAERYLAIEQQRFEQRLNVRWSVPDELGTRPVPAFLLQPLVENAIKHGIAPRAAGGTLVVRAYTEADDLLLEVEDDGAGAAASSTPGFGIGLSATRARLQTLYGTAHLLQLLPSARGCIARIRLPSTPMAEAAA